MYVGLNWFSIIFFLQMVHVKDFLSTLVIYCIYIECQVYTHFNDHQLTILSNIYRDAYVSLKL